MEDANYTCFEKGGENERIKILLVYPKVGSEAKGMSLHLPLSVLHIASYLKDFSVAIFDQRVDPIENFYKLLEQKPLCVGISTMTGIQIKYALEIAEKVKEKEIPTIFGGVHPTIFPEQTSEDRRVDYVVVGDGELSFKNLVETLAKGEKPEKIIQSKEINLEDFPSLPYELVNVENYVHTAIIEGRALPFLFSRGCPFACTFCCNPIISKRRWRVMNIDNAIKQLNELLEKYNLDSIIFWDENLTVNPRILNKLAEKINRRFKWRMQARMNSLLNYDLKFLEKMGVISFSIGLESGSDKILKEIKKEETVEEYISTNRKLAETNILIWYNYMVGYPNETLEDLKATVNLAINMLDENPNAEHNTFGMLVPYPETEIASFYVKSNLLPKSLEGWSEFGHYNFSVGWHSPEMTKLYQKICFSSKFTGRKLVKHFPNDKELKEYADFLMDKWRKFDFYDDEEWKNIINKGWEILRKLFGENAY
ncbi:MAG: radical SAM protein [Nanoarchaeota archaeon]